MGDHQYLQPHNYHNFWKSCQTLRGFFFFFVPDSISERIRLSLNLSTVHCTFTRGFIEICSRRASGLRIQAGMFLTSTVVLEFMLTGGQFALCLALFEPPAFTESVGLSNKEWTNISMIELLGGMLLFWFQIPLKTLSREVF